MFTWSPECLVTKKDSDTVYSFKNATYGGSSFRKTTCRNNCASCATNRAHRSHVFTDAPEQLIRLASLSSHPPRRPARSRDTVIAGAAVRDAPEHMATLGKADGCTGQQERVNARTVRTPVETHTEKARQPRHHAGRPPGLYGTALTEPLCQQGDAGHRGQELRCMKYMTVCPVAGNGLPKLK